MIPLEADRALADHLRSCSHIDLCSSRRDVAPMGESVICLVGGDHRERAVHAIAMDFALLQVGARNLGRPPMGEAWRA